MHEYLLCSPSFRIRICAVVLRSTSGTQRGSKSECSDTIMEKLKQTLTKRKQFFISLASARNHTARGTPGLPLGNQTFIQKHSCCVSAENYFVLLSGISVLFQSKCLSVDAFFVFNQRTAT